jgi:hypothetical protein
MQIIIFDLFWGNAISEGFTITLGKIFIANVDFSKAVIKFYANYNF